MSGAGHGKPDPEGHHDDLDQADLEGLSLLVPDDARSLDADRLAYLEELREQARHGWRRMVFTRRWVRFGLSGPLVTLVLVGVTIVGSLMVVFAPKPQPVPGPAPLAVGAPGQVGEVGGLLPAESVMANGLEVALRSVRPAVFVLVPRDCPECNTISSIPSSTR